MGATRLTRLTRLTPLTPDTSKTQETSMRCMLHVRFRVVLFYFLYFITLLNPSMTSSVNDTRDVPISFFSSCGHGVEICQKFIITHKTSY